jgi:hypothetical protein
MSDAVPLTDLTGAGQDALAALRFNWGEAYEISHDDEHGWHARRLDGLGGLISGSDPEGLRAAIWEDYGLKPVPRGFTEISP